MAKQDKPKTYTEGVLSLTHPQSHQLDSDKPLKVSVLRNDTASHLLS